MARLTLIKSQTSEPGRLATLLELRDHILFMIDFYHQMRVALGLLPDGDLPRPRTALEAAAERTWSNQEPTP